MASLFQNNTAFTNLKIHSLVSTTETFYDVNEVDQRKKDGPTRETNIYFNT